MRSLTLFASALLLSSVSAATHEPAPATSEATPAADANWLTAAVNAPSRTEANRARDKYRNPAETLAFFGIKAGDTVVEISPGAGWYTEILAPMSKAGGNALYVAGPWARFSRLQNWAAEKPEIYGDMKFAEFPASGAHPIVAANSADAVLTFRNVHNWRMASAEQAAANFREIYAMLKPGGVLGVVEHRLDESADSALEEKSGYMKESSVIALAEAAGFQLAARSEINANPKDIKDYPKGVWTLPPSLAEKELDREKYLAIGESDRMTLKFIKPAN